MYRILYNQLIQLKNQINLNKYIVVSVGTTGSARKLIGTILDASVVKNEITAHAVGTTSIYPNVRTIFEIGGQDSKIIILEEESQETLSYEYKIVFDLMKYF